MSKSLTVDKIKEIIREEKASLKSAGVISPDTVDGAWSGGDNLVNKIDYVKKLGIKEQKYRKKADVYRKLREKLQESIKRSR
jgi:hypothetical protein|tara:strand:- start:860 stop:1105 length:246 start_codon:yes stop_codon:yes gene_type:complete